MADQPLSRLSFFQARDLLDTELDYEKLVLSGPQNVVFRYLLEHTVFDKKADDYGWVTKNALGIPTIMKRTGLKKTATIEALKVLTSLGLISRVPRPILSGGSQDALIYVNWLPKDRETVLREGPGNGPHEGPGNGPSFLTSEEPEEEHHHDAGCKEDSPKAKSTAKADDGAVAPRESDWVGSGERATDNREFLAGGLGVGLDSIGAPHWRYLDDLDRREWESAYSGYAGCSCLCEADCPHGEDECQCQCPCPVSGTEECECMCEHTRATNTAYGAYQNALGLAALDSAGKRNPVGYFRSILPGYISEAHSDPQAMLDRYRDKLKSRRTASP